jgi:hypothetical protein
MRRKEDPPRVRTSIVRTTCLTIALAMGSLACGSNAHLPPAGAPMAPPIAPLDANTDDARPLFVDANADGVADIVVRARSPEAYLAIDGSSGATLWTSTPTKEHLGSSFAFFAGPALVSVSRYVATLFDVRTGSIVAAVDLEADGAFPCAAPPGAARWMNVDGTVSSVDVASLKLGHESKDAECREIPSDLAMRREVIERRYRPVPWLRADTPALACGRWEAASFGSGTDEHIDEADPCAIALGTGERPDALGELEPDVVIPIDAGALVFGARRRGHPFPAVALVANGSIVWSVILSTTTEGPPRRFAVARDRIGVLLDGKVRTFDAKTGAVISESPVPSTLRWIDAAPTGWLASGDKSILAFADAPGLPRPLRGAPEDTRPPWTPGAPVPPGYRVVRGVKRDWPWVGLGLASMIALHALNLGLGIALADDGVWPLDIPVVGPFIALGTIPHLDAGVGQLFIYDFALQAGAITVFSAAVAGSNEEPQLVPSNAVSVGPGSLRVSF